MPKTEYFTAASLDGFIADPGLSVLLRAESGMPGTGQHERAQG